MSFPAEENSGRKELERTVLAGAEMLNLQTWVKKVTDALLYILSAPGAEISPMEKIQLQKLYETGQEALKGEVSALHDELVEKLEALRARLIEIGVLTAPVSPAPHSDLEPSLSDDDFEDVFGFGRSSTPEPDIEEFEDLDDAREDFSPRRPRRGAPKATGPVPHEPEPGHPHPHVPHGGAPQPGHEGPVHPATGGEGGAGGGPGHPGHGGGGPTGGDGGPGHPPEGDHPGATPPPPPKKSWLKKIRDSLPPKLVISLALAGAILMSWVIARARKDGGDSGVTAGGVGAMAGITTTGKGPTGSAGGGGSATGKTPVVPVIPATTPRPIHHEIKIKLGSIKAELSPDAKTIVFTFPSTIKKEDFLSASTMGLAVYAPGALMYRPAPMRPESFSEKGGDLQYTYTIPTDLLKKYNGFYVTIGNRAKSEDVPEWSEPTYFPLRHGTIPPPTEWVPRDF